MARLPLNYPHGDQAFSLINWAVNTWSMPFHAGQSLIEVGCNETDFLETITALGLHAVGIDCRPGPGRANMVQIDAFDYVPPVKVDWVVLLGTLEHIGLGYYGDRVKTDGDIELVATIADAWLLPGGMLWYDVPFNPISRIPENRHFRVYDGRALERRLDHPKLVELGRAYTLDCGPLPVETMAEPLEPRDPFYFVQRWLVRTT
jgi:hypothetical protein